jgi:hypothetical protein
MHIQAIHHSLVAEKVVVHKKRIVDTILHNASVLTMDASYQV